MSAIRTRTTRNIASAVLLTLTATLLSMSVPQRADASEPPGGGAELDASFGSGGLVTTLGPTYPGADVAVQADGKAVVVGSTTDGKFLVMRYDLAGNLDPSFGSGGRVTTSIEAGPASANAVAIQPDGRIVVVGGTGNGSHSKFAVARYRSNGSLDRFFGLNGVVVTDVQDDEDSAEDVAIHNGGIVVGGWTRSSDTGVDFGVVRYLAGGSLDPWFGTNGRVVTPVSIGDDSLEAVRVQPDGRIVVAGTSEDTVDNDLLITVARYEKDGSPDRTFGREGTVLTDVGEYESGEAVEVLADGRILVGGNSDGMFTLLCYLADGTLDKNFGTDGIVVTDVGEGPELLSGLTLVPSRLRMVDPTIVAVGRLGSDFAIARYTLNGKPFGAFGENGIVTTDFGGTDGATAVAVQDGKILAVGYTAASTVALARYIAHRTFPNPQP